MQCWLCSSKTQVLLLLWQLTILCFGLLWFGFGRFFSVCVFCFVLTPERLQWITFAQCVALSLLLFCNKTAFEDRNHCAAWTFKQGMTYFLASMLSATSFLLPRATKRDLGREVLGNLSWGGVATSSFYLLLFLLKAQGEHFPLLKALLLHQESSFHFWLLRLNRHYIIKGTNMQIKCVSFLICQHLVVVGTIKFTFWAMLFLVCHLDKVVGKGKWN